MPSQGGNSALKEAKSRSWGAEESWILQWFVASHRYAIHLWYENFIRRERLGKDLKRLLGEGGGDNDKKQTN